MDKRELRQAVRLRNGIPDAGDGLAEHVTIDDCVAAALADTVAEGPWPWLLTSASLTFTAGVAPLPTGWSSSRSLLVNGYQAPHVGLDEFLNRVHNFVWTDQGANVAITPTPTTAPTSVLWYYRVEPDLTIDTSTPLLPAVHHRALVARASYHLNVRRKDNDRMGIDDAEWRAGLARMLRAKHAATGTTKIRSAFRPKQTAWWS